MDGQSPPSPTRSRAVALESRTLRDRSSAARDRSRCLCEGTSRTAAAAGAFSSAVRFHAAIDELSGRELDSLPQVDQVDHEAIVALDLDHPEVPGIGAARYICDPCQHDVAEAVVAVADRDHGRGVVLGTEGPHALRETGEGGVLQRSSELPSVPEEEQSMAERQVEIHNDVGLHARPATVFTNTAAGYDADVSVVTDEGEANAKSVLSVLGLDIRPGARFTIRAEGDDAQRAVDELAELVESWS